VLYPSTPVSPIPELLLAITAVCLLSALFKTKNRQRKEPTKDLSEIRKLLRMEVSSIKKPPSKDKLNQFANRTGLSLDKYLVGLEKGPPVYQGMKALMENDYETATKLFNKNANKQLKEASINLFLGGNGLYLQGKYKAALTAYQKSITINPGFAKAWHNCGMTLEALGLHEKAKAKYKKAQELGTRPAEVEKDPRPATESRIPSQRFKGKRKKRQTLKTGLFKKRKVYAPVHTRPYQGSTAVQWLILTNQ
jgi:tetratricopeptide (TPR) repeat protein